MNVFLSEFKRMLMEKKIIYIFIFLIFLFLIIVSLDFIPAKIYGEYCSALSVWQGFLNSRIMTGFIALFPVFIYCGSFGDDVETNFINNIVLRSGFKKYFINKYLVTVLSGGLLYFVTSIVTFYTSWLMFGINLTDESLKDVIKIKLFNNYLFGGYITIPNLVMYSIIVSCVLFLLGIIYSSVGFLISLYVNNKVFIFGISVLSLRLYEDTVFTFSPILGPFLNIEHSKFYSIASIFNSLGGYSNINALASNLIIFSIIIFIIIIKYYQFKKIYSEN